MEQQDPIRYVHMDICQHEMECIRQAAMSLLKQLNQTEESGLPFSDETKAIIGAMFITGHTALAKIEFHNLEFNAKEMSFMQLAIQTMIDQAEDMIQDLPLMERLGQKGADNIRNIHALALGIKKKLAAATGEDIMLPEVTQEDHDWLYSTPH